MSFVIVSLIILVSAIVQGATSFGFSLLALPLLGYFYNLKIIVPTLVIFSIVLNLIILLRLRLVPKFKELAILAFFAICFIPVGVNVLIFVDEILLKRIVGLLLIIISVIMFKGITIKLKHKTFSYMIAGILSGILNGAVSLSGPPIVVLLASDQKNKNEFRASLTFLFLLLNVVTIFLFANKGLFENKEIINMLFLLPVMIMGTFVGIYLGNKIDEQKFKKIVLILLMIMGILNLF
ncbi:sulfite exporter TauE/SafE family protein [Fusibacter bizertensis]|uniref:Probable membrane transporter protein n=1 Tax=Fusibacter bizertensis TaxID=1488331 RepID=A0ABT6ND47_9FIRM|nr:sulfite exporter TauE/SafE family protein [Fusibacter bizertensis]MDH8678345.1 sulfite exporter TauE/SafE family protein [Fusibacter bizertensis]